MKYLILTLSVLIAAQAWGATLEATTKSGKKVLLNENGTWAYASAIKADNTPPVKLEMILRKPVPNGCRFGFRMTNGLHYRIDSFVLVFTAFKPGNIPYETVSRGWSYIKPTLNQYQEVLFRGVECDEVDKLQITSAKYCDAGDLTRYTADEQTCLELIDLQSTGEANVFKKPFEPQN